MKAVEGSQIERMEEAPIFSLSRVDWERRMVKGNLKGKTRSIQRVAISSNVAVVGTSLGTVLRWKLNDSREAEEIELNTKGEDVIDRIFLDPTGNHTIIGCKNGEAFYLHSKSNKAKRLSKFQGSLECAAFDRFTVNESSSKSILLGTSMGCLYEVVLESNGKERFFQLLYQLNPPIPINSVYYESNSSTSDGTGAGDRCYALFSTDNPLRLYHLVGSSSINHVFAEYGQGTDIPFVELPGDISRASLLCYSKVASAKAETFALLTGAGIYHGSLREIRDG